MPLRCYQFNLKFKLKRVLRKNKNLKSKIFFLDYLNYRSNSVDSDKPKINYKKFKLSFYFSNILKFKRDYYSSIIKLIKTLENLNLKILKIKTKIIVVLFIFKFITLFIKKCLSGYLDIVQLGSSALERIYFDFYYILYLVHIYNKSFSIIKDNMFISFCLLICFIFLFVVNLMIIFRIFILIFTDKIYRLFIFISLIFPLSNIKQFIKWSKIFGVIIFYIFKIFNTGLIAEDSLFTFFQNFDNFREFNKIYNIRSFFLGNDSTNSLIIFEDNSQSTSSNLSLVNTNNNNQLLREEKNELEKNISEISDSENSDNELSDNIEINLIKSSANFNFTNFNKDLNIEDKYNYLKLKFYNKGLDSNLPFLDWFINLLINTDGNKINIDKIIDFNLNHILKIERETKLNNLAFFRNKPFLMNKFDNSPLAFPSVIPIFKGLYIYGEED